MCNCPPIDLMCAAVGKLARVPPGMVEAIYARLERDGDRAARLTPPLLAAAFRFRPHMVERAVEAMVELGVLRAGIVTSDWHVTLRHAVTRDVTLSRVMDHGVTLDDEFPEGGISAFYLAKIERTRRLARERQKRKRDRDKAANVTLVTVPEEKEEDHGLRLSEEGAREVVSDNAPLGFQRKQGWATSVMRRAEQARLLSNSEAAKLWNGLMLMRADPSLPNWGLSRRVNDELDRLDKILRDQAARSPPVQSEMLMPILGGATVPATASRPGRLTADDILNMRRNRGERATSA